MLKIGKLFKLPGLLHMKIKKKKTKNTVKFMNEIKKFCLNKYLSKISENTSTCITASELLSDK